MGAAVVGLAVVGAAVDGWAVVGAAELGAAVVPTVVAAFSVVAGWAVVAGCAVVQHVCTVAVQQGCCVGTLTYTFSAKKISSHFFESKHFLFSTN